MIKLNCDGAFSSSDNAVGLGGAFQNSNGDWIVGFHKASQAISPTHAELTALLEGLKIAKEMNFLNLEIETDFEAPTPEAYFTEGNEVAHMLAKQAIKSPPSTKCFFHACLPFFVEQEVIKNKHGVFNSVKNISTSVCNYLATMGNSNALKTLTMPM
ncbi:PREDICTED: uncharacterized protein LOC109239805 [Nicotiana attenuata]|uniref:uncharacterized protein LOC109239805 n=1 Tax=Nicotiana attenuata TaxID=49451 RepID=UPI000904DE8E|nr:PREDICTED: uncharacterized protein LOC109239805 [Nicotiana attenuata]